MRPQGALRTPRICLPCGPSLRPPKCCPASVFLATRQSVMVRGTWCPHRQKRQGQPRKASGKKGRGAGTGMISVEAVGAGGQVLD